MKLKPTLVWLVVMGICLLTDGAGAAAPPAAPRRIFTWKDLSLPEYTGYISALRTTGCPENRIRDVIVGDINEMFEQQRLQEAIEANADWWRPIHPYLRDVQPDAQARREALRAELLTQHLGANQTNDLKLPPLVSGVKHNLTGPVLGAMPIEKFARLVKICEDYEARIKAYQLANQAEGRPTDTMEEVKIREEMRSQARQLLTPPEYEEYLVHNSGHAWRLRQDLRAFHPTEEEFRMIFRALDPLRVRMQLEFGTEQAMSARQLEEYTKSCDQFVQEILKPERFRLYLLSREPAYLQAADLAARHKLDFTAVPRLYATQRDQATRRAKIEADASLTPETKAEQLKSIDDELQRLLSDPNLAQRGGQKQP